MADKFETVAEVRAWILRRRRELHVDRQAYRAEGDTMQAYEATGVLLELGELLAMLPEPVE